MFRRHVSAIACAWLLCLALLDRPVLADPTADAVAAALDQEGVPMKSVPIHLMPRSNAGRKRTLNKFQPKDSIQLRFIDAEKGNYGACHHVDMDVELKSEDGKSTVQSLNPYAFQHAVNSISCSGTQFHLKLASEFANQVRRWNLSPSKVIAIVIPHDFVDLKKNPACYQDLDTKAKKWIKEHPLETVVKMVKNVQFLDAKDPNTVSLTVVQTNLWSQLNRAQSVRINHRPLDEMIPLYFSKRSIGEQQGPMWDYEHDMQSATSQVAGLISNQNVNANMDQSSVKGYAQADMSWSQTCIKNIFTGSMDCAKWGISNSKISGMTQINHQAQVSVKNSGTLSKRNGNPMLTLTNINVTTPSFNLMTPIPLLGFSVPGVFDMGANVALTGAVSVAILVQATKDVLVNTGSSASCPWIIDWNGSFTQIPTIQFGTCTLPTASKRKRSLSLQERDVGSDSSTQTRQTAAVSIGMTVAPSVGMALNVFGFTALSAGIGSPIHVDVNTHWDTDSTTLCPANNVATSLDGNAALQLTGSFFGFSKAIPVVQSPTLATPAVCIPHI
ncbi:hypothetical protein EMPS_02284 [Entomortierella parvispora]|uniref:Uncharacterized protein n=1 Tax=Entomortierella parvispora TaxID=205924 RepID=A0A9P3H4N6_9FUNG|nr:hypothetical protein EMPS_02284 [Entomortierella parvispora]